MTDIDKTLAERGARYGEFIDHAVIAQGLKDVMWQTDGWLRLAPDQRQALEVIGDKIARILNGDPNYADNWHDIIGYAKLVETRLTKPAAQAAEFDGARTIEHVLYEHARRTYRDTAASPRIAEPYGGFRAPEFESNN